MRVFKFRRRAHDSNRIPDPTRKRIAPTCRTQCRLREEGRLGDVGQTAILVENGVDARLVETGPGTIEKESLLARVGVSGTADSDVTLEIGLEACSEADDAPLSSLQKHRSGVGLEVGEIEPGEHRGGSLLFNDEAENGSVSKTQRRGQVGKSQQSAGLDGREVDPLFLRYRSGFEMVGRRLLEIALLDTPAKVSSDNTDGLVLSVFGVELAAGPGLPFEKLAIASEIRRLPAVQVNAR